MTNPPYRALTDTERLAALREHLALGRAARLHFFPGGASFEHEGTIVRVRDEEIVRAIAGQSLSWEDEEGDPVTEPPTVEPVIDRAVVNLIVVERTRTYHATTETDDVPRAEDNDLLGEPPAVR